MYAIKICDAIVVSDGVSATISPSSDVYAGIPPNIDTISGGLSYVFRLYPMSLSDLGFTQLIDQGTPAANTADFISKWVSGARLMLPPGDYRLDSFNAPSSIDVVIKGSSSQSSNVVICDDTGKAGINLVGTHTDLTLCGFQITRETFNGFGLISSYGSTANLTDITIDGVKFSCPVSSWNAISVYLDKNSSIDGMVISNCEFTNVGRMCIEFWTSCQPNEYSVKNVQIKKCYFRNWSISSEALAISYVLPNNSNTRIIDCFFCGNGTPQLVIELGKNIIVDACQFDDSLGGLNACGGSGESWGSVSIFNSIAYTKKNTNGIVYVYSGTLFNIINCTLPSLQLRNAIGLNIYNSLIEGISIENAKSNFNVGLSILGVPTNAYAIGANDAPAVGSVVTSKTNIFKTAYKVSPGVILREV